MNTMLKTTSDTSNCSNNLQSVNNYGILHEEITEMNECLQKMHICRMEYVACYAEACKLSSSELQKKQTGEATADEENADEGDDSAKKDPTDLHKNVIKNLMCMATQLESCRYAICEMKEIGMPPEQMSSQHIKQCKNWLISVLCRNMLNALSSLINIFKETSKKNSLQQQLAHQIMWINGTKEQAMKVVKFLDGDNVPHNCPETYEKHVEKLKQANIDVMQKHEEMMAQKKPKGWDSVMKDKDGNTYSFEQSLEYRKNMMVCDLLQNIDKKLHVWENEWIFVRIQHDVLQNPKKITDFVVQLQNNINQLVLTITQIMPLSGMEFSSECLTNAFQEQVKKKDSVCLANAFRKQVKIREQQDRTKSSITLEGRLKKIFKSEEWITSMALPVLKSFADCKRSFDFIKKQENVIKNIRENAMCFIQNILDNAMPSSHFLSIAQKKTYNGLCRRLPCSLDIIRNQYHKLWYYLEDMKSKEQEISKENIEEMKNWIKESSMYLVITDHINVLQGQLMCVGESARHDIMLSKKEISDLSQEISYYEMKANHLMVYHINKFAM